MPHAHVEMLSGVVRVFDDGKDFVDDYDFCVTVRGLDPHTVEIVGATKAPTGEQVKAIRRALKDMGINKAVWKRFRLGVPHIVEVT